MAHIDANEKAFAIAVSIASKIDPRVVIAWMAQEGAFSGNESGKYNYLNIMGPNGHPVSFNSISEAITSTIKVIRQPNMKVIINTARTQPTPSQQINAIGSSPWGTNGPNLRNTFASIFGGQAGLNDRYVGPDQAQIIANTALSGNASAGGIGIGRGPDPIGSTPSVVTAAVDAIPGVGAINSIGDFFKWIGGNWDRVLFVMGGTILVIIGIIVITKQNNTFTFAPRGE